MIPNLCVPNNRKDYGRTKELWFQEVDGASLLGKAKENIRKLPEKHQENHLEQAPVQEKSLKMDIPPVMAILLKKS